MIATAAFAKELPSPVTLGPDGKLVYTTEPSGDRVIDFSHAGYGGGGVSLPDAPARVRVEPAEGDDGVRIQAAIDQVSRLAPDAHGMRGAVWLARGRFEIAGQLRITASGVVLRGSGAEEDGTVLIATGTDRRALIEITGRDVREGVGEPIVVTDDYVPAGGGRLHVAHVDGLAKGTRIAIVRPSPEAWIAHVGMDEAPARQPYRWKAGAFDVRWDRVVTDVVDDLVTLDVPLTVALDAKFGGATVTSFRSRFPASSCRPPSAAPPIR